jgi:hypothetical protein
MRVCLHPEACPFAAEPVLDRWQRALESALPGDSALVSALLVDIAFLGDIACLGDIAALAEVGASVR